MFRRILSPGLFGLVFICFFLPWINISCQKQSLVKFNGFELATGSVPSDLQRLEKQMDTFQDIFGGGYQKNQSKLETSSNKPETYVLIAFICVIAGIVLSFIKGKIGEFLAAATGAISFIFIILEKIRINSEISEVVKESQGFIHVDYLFGFYMTLILLLFAVIANIYFLTQKGYKSYAFVKSPTVKLQQSFKFCPECGTKNESVNAFCKECGTKFPI